MSRDWLVALLTAVPGIVALGAAYWCGMRAQKRKDSIDGYAEAIASIRKAEAENQKRARYEADHLKYLPNDYPDDNDIRLRVPGGPSSPSNKPPGV